MDYATAVKKVQATKPATNFMLIEVSYDKKIILPYKDGIAFLGALENAEVLVDTYGKDKSIGSFDRNTLQSNVMSYKDYMNIKIAALLQLSIAEVEKNELVTN